MTHSLALEKTASEDLVIEEDLLPDAPEQVQDPAKVEERMAIIDNALHIESTAGAVPWTDVKLEDLFDDASGDEKDEFSGTGISNTINGSSPQPPL